MRSSQHFDQEVRCGTTCRVDDDADGQARYAIAPGRWPVRRDVERAFWLKIAEGLTSEDAAIACGVSGPVGSRWFRERGGMPLIQLSPSSGR